MPIRSKHEQENSKLTDLEYVCLCAQGGLVTYVTPSLRAASVEIVDEDVIIHGIFDGPFTDEEAENIECVATEILTSIWPPSNATASVTRCDYPYPLEKHGVWVYMRYEPPYEPEL